MDERDPSDTESEWRALGVHSWAVSEWEKVGFSPFEAAMAQGDGFSPLFAAQYARKLRKSAASWIRAGVEPIQALQWHRRGLVPRQVSKR